jgi:methionine-rich copper-binding protein CopC
LAAGLVLSLTLPALAHIHLKTTNPKDGAVLPTPPSDIVLQFDGPIQVTAIKLIKRTGEAGEVALERDQGAQEAVTELVAHPAVQMAPGSYQLEWHGLAPDGHVMQGAFVFTIAQ